MQNEEDSINYQLSDQLTTTTIMSHPLSISTGILQTLVECSNEKQLQFRSITKTRFTSSIRRAIS